MNINTRNAVQVPNRAQENCGSIFEDSKTEDRRQKQTRRYKKKQKRTNGSARLRKTKTDRIQRWATQGISVGSINVAGVSLFKLHMILETNAIDILCI
jgi:hypothetical protein